MTHIRNKTIQGLSRGDIFSVSRTFTEGDMQAFADITRDYNPVHFDNRFATAKNFDDRICHGLLTASLITEIGGQIGWLATGMGFDFKKPVYFGDTITCNFTITDLDARGRVRADAVYCNQDGVTVIEATITGILPDGKERNILSQMVAEGDPTNGVRG
jgi:3-hydroxybutyryl-CoA dehydratase